MCGLIVYRSFIYVRNVCQMALKRQGQRMQVDVCLACGFGPIQSCFLVSKASSRNSKI